MSKRVLSIGNCSFDNGALHYMLKSNFNAELKMVDDLAGAERLMKAQPCALIIVNRLLEIDGSEGMDVIRALKAHPDYNTVPVMLLTNYPEYAAQAESLGAVPGFGKSALNSKETRERLASYLT